MKIVIDTNIIFSMLIVKNPKHEEILFGNVYEFFAPNFAVVELYEKKEKILKYTKMKPGEFRWQFEQLLRVIRFIRDVDVAITSKNKAYQLCKDIDLKDVPFIALSIDLDAPLWTGDKVLKNCLITKGYNNFFQLP